MPDRRAWIDGLPDELRREYESGAWIVGHSSDPLAVLRAIQDWRQGGGVEIMRLAVRDARAEGATWADIGQALGQSRQQAFRAWAKRLEDENPK